MLEFTPAKKRGLKVWDETARVHRFGRRCGCAVAGPALRSEKCPPWNPEASTRDADAFATEPFLAELKKLGYVEGKNLIVERRYAEGLLDRLPALAAEIIAFRPDLIFAPQGTACGSQTPDCHDPDRILLRQ